MSKQVLISLIIVIVVVVGYYFYSANLPSHSMDESDVLVKEEDRENDTDHIEDEETLLSYFNESLEDEVVRLFGQPIEGFVPDMFLSAFPGMKIEDFGGVEALLGVYQIRDGQLVFIENESEYFHSAVWTITSDGMEILYDNILARLDTVVESKEDIDKLVNSISSDIDTTKIECTPDQRGADFCAAVYDPVCGAKEVQCITVPCNPVSETYPNSCEACRDKAVVSYTKGECRVVETFIERNK